MHSDAFYVWPHESGNTREFERPDLDSRKNNGLRMSGLVRGVNDEALSAGVVMHGTCYNDYVLSQGKWVIHIRGRFAVNT